MGAPWRSCVCLLLFLVGVFAEGASEEELVAPTVQEIQDADAALAGLTTSLRSVLEVYHQEHTKAVTWADDATASITVISQKVDTDLQSIGLAMQLATAATATARARFTQVVADIKQGDESLSSTQVLKAKEDTELDKAIFELSGSIDMLNGVLATMDPAAATANATVNAPLLAMQVGDPVARQDLSSASHEVIGVLKGLAMDMEAQKASLEADRADKSSQYSDILVSLNAAHATGTEDFDRLSLQLQEESTKKQSFKAEDAQMRLHATDWRGVLTDVQAMLVKAARGPTSVPQFESELEGDVSHARALLADFVPQEAGSPAASEVVATPALLSRGPFVIKVLAADLLIGRKQNAANPRTATLLGSRRGIRLAGNIQQNIGSLPPLASGGSRAAAKLAGATVRPIGSRGSPPVSTQQRDLRRRLRELFKHVSTRVAANAIRRGASQFNSDALARLADRIDAGSRTDGAKLLNTLSSAVAKRDAGLASNDKHSLSDCEQRRVVALSEIQSLHDQRQALTLRNATLGGEIIYLKIEEEVSEKHAHDLKILREALPTLSAPPVDLQRQFSVIHDITEMLNRADEGSSASAYAGELAGLRVSLSSASQTLQSVIDAESVWMNDLQSEVISMGIKLDNLQAKASREILEFKSQGETKEGDYNNLQDQLAALLTKRENAKQELVAAEHSCDSVQLLASHRQERASRQEGFLREASDLVKPQSTETTTTIIF